jgi:hypothetical protein
MKPLLKLPIQFFFLLAIQAYSQPNSFDSRGIGGGGALFSPSINPDFGSEIFMACDMSEIYHTENLGLKWTILPFTKIQGGHDSKMQFTKIGDIRYCIDYKSKDGSDYVQPVKSIDRGLTWKTFAANPYPNDVCYNLTADYNHPDRLILGFYGEIYFSKDGGSSFNKIYTCKSNNEGNHIAGTLFKNDSIFIGLNDGLLYSTNGGNSFSLMNTTGIPSGEKMLSFSAGMESGKLRFVCLTLNNVWAGIQHAFEYSSGTSSSMQGVYVMDNADGTWKSRLNGINKSTDFPVFTGMAENNMTTMYLSGGSSTGAPIVMKSTDAGVTWKHVFMSNLNKNIVTGWSGHLGDRAWSYGECPFGFNVSPKNANQVIFTDFGFAHSTINGGTSWNQLYVDPSTQNSMNLATPKQKKYKGVGLENTTNWNILWLDSNQLFASFSDINGIMSDDKGKSWKFIPNLSQNSVYHIVKHNDGTLYAATSTIHDIYQSTRLTDNIIDAGLGAIYFSTDQGTSFKLLHDFKHPVIWLAIDPKNPKRMLASVIHSVEGGIYETTDLDKGAVCTWKKLTNPPRTQGHPFVIKFLKNGHLVVSFSGRRTGSPQQFSASSGVFYSSDGGNTWSDKSITAMKYWTKDVVIDPHDETESTWYVSVFSGWGSIPANTGGLYRTIDRGENWAKISSPNASYRVNSCTINPENKNEIYYTTETDGLWYSSNATSTLPTFKLVDAYPFRHPVRVTYNPYKNSEIWVSGFGSGMMTGSFASSSSTKPLLKAASLVLYPNPSKNQLHFLGARVNNYRIYNLNGEIITHNSLTDETVRIIDISTLNKGLYYIVFQTDEGVIIKNFIKE